MSYLEIEKKAVPKYIRFHIFKLAVNSQRYENSNDLET